MVVSWRYADLSHGVIKTFLCSKRVVHVHYVAIDDLVITSHVHYVAIDDLVITTPLKKRCNRPLVMLW